MISHGERDGEDRRLPSVDPPPWSKIKIKIDLFYFCFGAPICLLSCFPPAFSSFLFPKKRKPLAIKTPRTIYKTRSNRSRGKKGEGMILPVVKLGALAFRTLSKPFASRLKQQAGNYPKFRDLIVGLAQVCLDPPSSSNFLFWL